MGSFQEYRMFSCPAVSECIRTATNFDFKKTSSTEPVTVSDHFIRCGWDLVNYHLLRMLNDKSRRKKSINVETTSSWLEKIAEKIVSDLQARVHITHLRCAANDGQQLEVAQFFQETSHHFAVFLETLFAVLGFEIAEAPDSSTKLRKKWGMYAEQRHFSGKTTGADFALNTENLAPAVDSQNERASKKRLAANSFAIFLQMHREVIDN